MKKFLITVFTIVAFAIYAISLRTKNNNPSIAPATSAMNTTNLSNTVSSPVNATGTKYNDGQFIGDVADAYYGNVQVKITINGGKISDVQFLDYPQDRRTSQQINSQAMPLLKTEVIQAQSANINGVTGASATSQAFLQSLQSALSKASA